MMTVKLSGALIFCVHKNEMHGKRGREHTANGVSQQGGSKPTALKVPVQSQTTEQHGGNTWIAGKFPRNVWGQIGHRNAGRGQRVVGRNLPAGRLRRYEAVG